MNYDAERQRSPSGDVGMEITRVIEELTVKRKKLAEVVCRREKREIFRRFLEIEISKKEAPIYREVCREIKDELERKAEVETRLARDAEIQSDIKGAFKSRRVTVAKDHKEEAELSAEIKELESKERLLFYMLESN